MKSRISRNPTSGIELFDTVLSTAPTLQCFSRNILQTWTPKGWTDLVRGDCAYQFRTKSSGVTAR